jgi:glycosyltransferase involved in cell wall biosynthesis
LPVIYEPKISVITPSFNQGKYIEKTILSVLEQNYPNLEYIIIDGGSTDKTNDVIAKFHDRITHYESEKDRGQAHALNKGFARATGDIIAWINSDDWYDKHVFNAVVEAFRSPETNVVIGNCTMVYEDDHTKNFIDKPGEVSFGRMLRYWKPFFCPPQPAIFFKKALLETVGYLDETLVYGMDLDLWLRMAKRQTFKYVDQNFAFYLIHAASKSGSDNGFAKFLPEWKEVSRRHLRSSSIIQKFRFYKDYYSR